MAQHAIHLTINSEPHELTVQPNRTLLDVLREDLGLTGTNKSCGTGDCGACTVLMDGLSVNSCLTLAVEADGTDVVTVEGLARERQLHPVQEGFVKHNAIQCGFCSPGMIMAGAALLERNPSPTDEEIRRGLEGNLCRCTGYTKIVDAVRWAAERMNDATPVEDAP